MLARARLLKLNECSIETKPVKPDPCVEIPGLQERLSGGLVPNERPWP